MEEKELEVELINLAQNIRETNPPSHLIPSTLKILKGKAASSSRPSLRATLYLIPGKQSPLLRLTPAILVALFFFISIYLFSFTGDPVFNVIKISLLVFSFTMGSLFILNPEKMVGIDRKIIGTLLNKGAIATPLQEIILFRLQGLYFILIAFFVCKL